MLGEPAIPVVLEGWARAEVTLQECLPGEGHMLAPVLPLVLHRCSLPSPRFSSTSMGLPCCEFQVPRFRRHSLPSPSQLFRPQEQTQAPGDSLSVHHTKVIALTSAVSSAIWQHFSTAEVISALPAPP